jgi:hypothetical protein
MNDYIRMSISSDLFGEKPQQNVEVLGNVPVRTIVYEILKEFSLKGAYALWWKNTKQELDVNRTLAEQHVTMGAELEFGQRALRFPAGSTAITGKLRGYFRADGDGRTFQLAWQPALIGRSTDAASATQLAVDLKDLDTAKTVSRQHAQVTENNGDYLIQRLADNNQLVVDGRQLPRLTPVALKNGSVIKVGNLTLAFVLEEASDE